MSEREWLNNLSEGDPVIVLTMGTPSAYRRVSRTTRTQIVVDNSKFGRKDGKAIGSNPWAQRFIQEPTEERVRDFKVRAARRYVATKAEKVADNATEEEAHELANLMNRIIKRSDNV